MIRVRKIIYLFIMFLCLISEGLYGQKKSEVNYSEKSFLFSFYPSSDVFYLNYLDNERNLDECIAFINSYKEDLDRVRIVLNVKGYSSGMSGWEQNIASAKIRANRVKSELILRTQVGLTESNFLTSNHSRTLSGKKSVVIVKIGSEEKFSPKLSSVMEGSPEINNSETRKPSKVELLQENDKSEGEDRLKDSNKVDIRVSEVYYEEDDSSTDIEFSQEKSKFGIRTNLLYWAVGVLNAGVEWNPNSNTGIILNGGWNHWTNDSNSKQYRLWFINPEYRVYLGDLKHFYVGLEGHIGQFNLKFNKTGRQGDFIGAGLSGGYRTRLSNKLDIDFNLGAGYTHVYKYEKFTHENGTNKLISGREKKNLWGPTQLGVTLVWGIR